MTGIERIQKSIEASPYPGVMTHVVAGYPDLETTETLLLTMAEKGATMIEVQLPFSDPTADGRSRDHCRTSRLFCDGPSAVRA